jgi:hypothetical protein
VHRLTPAPAHEVRVVDGRFTSAVCSCGWTGGAHRTRARARQEARDHALLYADAGVLASAPPTDPVAEVAPGPSEVDQTGSPAEI